MLYSRKPVFGQIYLCYQPPSGRPGLVSQIAFWSTLIILNTLAEPSLIEPTQIDDTYEPFEQWVNFNAFAARVLESGLVKWYHFAVWSFRDALEEKELESKDCWYYRIRAAAQWIEQSGNMLFHSLSNTELTERDLNNMSNGLLYQGEGGLSKERWNFWKMKFRALAKLDVSEDVKAIAIRAAEQMEEKEDEENEDEEKKDEEKEEKV